MIDIDTTSYMFRIAQCPDFVLASIPLETISSCSVTPFYE